MEKTKIISGITQDEIWQQIESDLSQDSELFGYNINIDHQGKNTNLIIDIDLGGGFEGGYAFTTFTSPLTKVDDFRFALHHKGFIDQIGKFFGMQDVLLGYPEFDDKIIVKTNHAEKLKDILSDPKTREILQIFPEFNFHIGHHSSNYTQVESLYLELRIDDGIIDPFQLREIYNAFISTLEKIDILNRADSFIPQHKNG